MEIETIKDKKFIPVKDEKGEIIRYDGINKEDITSKISQNKEKKKCLEDENIELEKLLTEIE